MTYAVILGLVLLASLVVGVYVAGVRRAVHSFGEPTPQTAKIEAQAQAIAEAIVTDGEKDKAEVNHASRDELLSELRDRVRAPK